MNNNTRTTRTNKQNKTKKNRIKKREMTPNLIIPSPFPINTIRTLCCNTGPLIIANGAATFVVVDIAINDVFSGIPGIATPICAFYSALALAYSRNRVIEFSISYQLATNEPAVPVSFGLYFSDIQPSTVVLTRQLAIDALEKTPGSGMKQAGITQGMSIFRSPVYSIKCQSLVESGNFNGDTDYSANVSTAPPQKVWMGFVLVLGNAGLVTNGAIVNFRTEFRTKFFSLIN